MIEALIMSILGILEMEAPFPDKLVLVMCIRHRVLIPLHYLHKLLVE